MSGIHSCIYTIAFVAMCLLPAAAFAQEATPAGAVTFSTNFLAELDMELLSLKAATAYQSASKRRVSPPDFGPVTDER